MQGEDNDAEKPHVIFAFQFPEVVVGFGFFFSAECSRNCSGLHFG